MKLSVSTVERELYQGEITEVLLPAVDGEMAVLPGHAPFVVALGAGVIEIRSAGTEGVQHIAVTGGLADIQPETTTILAVGAEFADDLEEEAIVAARRQAQHAKTDARDSEEYATAAAALEKALAQEKALERRRRWRGGPPQSGR